MDHKAIDLDPIRQAITLQAYLARPDMTGKRLAATREQIRLGILPLAATVEQALDLIDQIFRYEPWGDAEPDYSLIAVMIDTIAFRHKVQSRETAWAAIGIAPDTGRRYTSPASPPPQWPVWFTLREFSVGYYAATTAFGKKEPQKCA